MQRNEGSNRMTKRGSKELVLFLFITTIVLSGCSKTISSSGQIETEEPFTTSIEEAESSAVTEESVKEYVKQNQEQYQTLFEELEDSEIHIDTRELKEQSYYFLSYIRTGDWSTSLYLVHEEEDRITGIDYILEGATEYFQYDLISISEGEFVSVYTADYMGNGNLALLNLERLSGRNVSSIPDYEFYAIDSHYEQMQFNNSPVISSVFEGGILLPKYEDVNQDGHTDVILQGIMEQYEYDAETDMQNLKRRLDVYQIYQYSEELGAFCLATGEDLREKRQVSLCDSVINNHELLNDSLCSEYKVQDIYQYSGKPKKLITQKCDEGMYRHYMVYDGIIYIVHGEKAIDEMQYIDYVILTNEIFSLSIGIQVGMEERELADTGLYFESFENGDDLDSELLSGKTGYLRKMKIKYDTIYYAEGSFEDNIALAVIVHDGKIVRIATDKLY